MKALARFAIDRLVPLTGLSEAWWERLVGVLVTDDRFTSRRRRDMRVGDLASLFNALMGGQTAQALEVDTMLRNLVYVSSAPASQAPIFAPRTWGGVLELMIQYAPPAAEPHRR